MSHLDDPLSWACEPSKSQLSKAGRRSRRVKLNPTATPHPGTMPSLKLPQISVGRTRKAKEIRSQYFGDCTQSELTMA